MILRLISIALTNMILMSIANASSMPEPEEPTSLEDGYYTPSKARFKVCRKYKFQADSGRYGAWASGLKKIHPNGSKSLVLGMLLQCASGRLRRPPSGEFVCITNICVGAVLSALEKDILPIFFASIEHQRQPRHHMKSVDVKWETFKKTYDIARNYIASDNTIYDARPSGVLGGVSPHFKSEKKHIYWPEIMVFGEVKAVANQWPFRLTSAFAYIVGVSERSWRLVDKPGGIEGWSGAARNELREKCFNGLASPKACQKLGRLDFSPKYFRKIPASK